MNTTTRGEELRAALRRIEPAVKGGPIRVVAAEGSLSLTACDGELLLTALVTAETVTSGEVLVTGRTLHHFVRGSVGDGLTLQLASGALDVRAGDGRISMHSLPPGSWTHFGHLPDGSDTWPTELTMEVGRVLHAAAKDPSRGVLYGVSLSDGFAVSTDGYRIAAVEVPLPDGFEAVVPTSLLKALLRAGLSEPVRVTATESLVTFGADTFQASALKIVGKFPNWQNVLPPVADGRLTFDRLELLAGLSRMAFLTDRDDLHTIAIESCDSALRMIVDVPDVGRQVESLAGSSTIDTILLNARSLREMAEHMYGDEITMFVEHPLAPAVVREPPALALVLPVRA